MNKMPKFRCWLLTYPRMYEVLEMRFHNQIPKVFNETEPSVSVCTDPSGIIEHFPISEVSLMQDTEFTDVDDKQIFEGDIVETCPVWMTDSGVSAIIFNSQFKSEIGLIDRYKGDWAIVQRREHCIWMKSLVRRLSDSPGCLSTYVKVIGNKWENPLLLMKQFSNKATKEIIDPNEVRKKIDDICKGKIPLQENVINLREKEKET